MKKLYQIELEQCDFNQTLDALGQRAIAWDKTARYHRSGAAPDDMLVEECRDAEEAEQIANHYRSIILSFHRAVAQDTSRVNF
jgi:hypothetical protein